MKILFFGAIASVISFFNSPSIELNRGEPEITKNFYTFNTKMELLYDSSFGETISTITRKDKNIVVKYESGKFKYHQHFTEDENGITITQVYQKFNIMLFINKEANVKYNKPVLKIPHNLEKGKNWNWSGYEYHGTKDSSKLDVTGKVLGMEKIVVPAGEFYTYKIETTFKNSRGSNNTIIEWIIPDIGMVKTKIFIKGGGLMGFVRDLLGYGEIDFELKKVIKNS